MTKHGEMVGRTFGRLTVRAFAGRNKDGRDLWLCECECGNEKTVIGKSLRSGLTLSCGCLHTEKMNSPRNPYNLPRRDYQKLRQCYYDMVRRCEDASSKDYEDYGKRGIAVCENWRMDFHSFARFAIANGWRPGLTIERIDFNKSYSPENCTFIPAKEQAKNRRSSIKITIGEDTKCLVDWCRIFGINPTTAYSRYRRLGKKDTAALFYHGRCSPS